VRQRPRLSQHWGGSRCHVTEPSHTVDCPEQNTVEGDYYFESPLPPIDELPYPPDWLVAELDAAFAPKPMSLPQPAGPVLSSETDVTERAIAYLAACPPTVSGQAGHNQTFAVTQALVNGFCLEPETALRLLQEHYNQRCEPPWSEKELQHKVDSALENPSEKQRGWLRDDSQVGCTHSADVSTLVDELTNFTSEPDQPSDKCETKSLGEIQPVDARFYICNEPPEIDTIIPFLLDRGDKMFIIGPPKVRKSFFTLQMALSIASGIDFLGPKQA